MTTTVGGTGGSSTASGGSVMTGDGSVGMTGALTTGSSSAGASVTSGQAGATATNTNTGPTLTASTGTSSTGTSSTGTSSTGTSSTGTSAGGAGAGDNGSIDSTGAAESTTAAGGTGSTGTDCEGGKVVHFVYFVEADATYSESQRADIEAQAYAFQQYWYEQLGATFYLNEPIVDVIEADNVSSWYLETPDGIHNDSRWYRLGNVKNEVYAKLGISNFDPNHRVVNYPTTRADGRVGGNFGGAWMDGDDLTCMAEPGGVNYPYADGAAAHCMGHVAHEFGHVLGLGHQGPQTDCMLYGFYNNSGGSGMCDFSAENVAQILAEPDNEGWFEALPGDNCRGA